MDKNKLLVALYADMISYDKNEQDWEGAYFYSDYIRDLICDIEYGEFD